MLGNAVASAKSARKIMEERGDTLTEEEKTYYRHVIEEGDRVEPQWRALVEEKIKQQERLRASRREELAKREAERRKELAGIPTRPPSG